MHEITFMRNRSRNILILVLAGVLATCLFLMLLVTVKVDSQTDFFGNANIKPPVDDPPWGGLFYKPSINDSLPHYLYQRLTDSLKRIEDERTRQNSSEMQSGMGIASLGVYSTEISPPGNVRQELIYDQSAFLDNLSVAAHKKMAATTNKDSIQMIKDQLNDTLAYYNSQFKREYLYYLGLKGYSLDKSSKFFVQNGTYNLAVPEWDSAGMYGKSVWHHGHYVRKQIPVRYATRDKLLLIPVSQRHFNILNTVMGVLFLSMLFFAAYCLLGFPLLILINISKGRAFDDINFKRFNIMTLVLLGWMLVKIISPYVLWLIYRKIIPDDFTMPNFWQLIWDNGQLFFIAVAIYIISKAFQKGNNLQKEQDLTI